MGVSEFRKSMLNFDKEKMLIFIPKYGINTFQDELGCVISILSFLESNFHFF